MMLLKQLPRLVDDKPWAAHLYVTDQCNLDCHYCNEYDNSVPHPATEDLKAWMKKIRDLGCLRLGFQGGEPLMHPDIAELTRYGKELGFERVSMSTNGFLLTKKLLAALEEAGLDSLQISVDRMTPIESTKKSLKTVVHKLDWFKGSKIKLNVSGVLFHETVGEMDTVVDTCLEKGVPVHARVIHDDLVNDRKLRLYPSTAPLLGFLEHQENLKREGKGIHSSWNILAYQKAMLRREDTDWTCVAGYKYFFVSAGGKFWPCSQVRTDKHILDVTPADLLTYNEKKSCQAGCGVYCTVDMSLAISHPMKYIGREAGGRIASSLATIRNAARSKTRKKQTEASAG